MPLAIDCKDEKGNVTRGLRNSLSGILGAGSFDIANKDTCWSTFHTSGHPFGADHRALIARAQGRYRAAVIAAGQDLDGKNLLTSPVECFAFGLTKVHKTAQDLIRQLEYMGLLADSKLLAGDDQRAVTFLATHDSSFANCFPATSDPTLPFTQREFQIALGRKMGSLLHILQPYIGARIRSNGNVPRTSTLTGTVSHQRLVYPEITSDASTIEWFVVWSSRFEQRGYQLKVDRLVHARTLSVNVSRSQM
jgi:hypothetical protein